MAKKKKKKNTVVNYIDSVNLEIDYDKLADSIIKAKKIVEEREAKQKEKELSVWRNSIGYKSHDDKTGLKRKIFVVFNGFKVFFNLIFFSKKKELKTSVTNAFMQSIVSAFFHLIKTMLWILVLAFLSVVFFHGNMVFSLFDYLYYIGFACVAFILSGIFRLMAIEIDQISDGERVIGVFTAVMSVIPMIEIIVGFFKEVR